jgi:pimeloyl-ACP methyl ester carboxylesterase
VRPPTRRTSSRRWRPTSATTDRLSEICAPTLIIGGSEDPFFPESLLRETAGKIPGAELRVDEGVGHGVPKERKRCYEDDALAFLTERRFSV